MCERERGLYRLLRLLAPTVLVVFSLFPLSFGKNKSRVELLPIWNSNKWANPLEGLRVNLFLSGYNAGRAASHSGSNGPLEKNAARSAKAERLCTCACDPESLYLFSSRIAWSAICPLFTELGVDSKAFMLRETTISLTSLYVSVRAGVCVRVLSPLPLQCCLKPPACH